MGGMGPMLGPEADEWINHVPTLDALSKSLVASQNLAKLAEEHPEIREKAEVDMGMGLGRGQRGQVQFPTLDQMTAGIQAHPEAVNAIESSGLSVRDYFKNTLSIVYGWAMFQVDQRGMLDQMLQMMPGLRKPASLEFISNNQAEVQKYIEAIQEMGE